MIIDLDKNSLWLIENLLTDKKGQLLIDIRKFKETENSPGSKILIPIFKRELSIVDKALNKIIIYNRR